MLIINISVLPYETGSPSTRAIASEILIKDPKEIKIQEI